MRVLLSGTPPRLRRSRKMRIFVKTGWVAAALMATAPSAQADTHMVPGSGFDMADNMSGGMAMDMSAMLRPDAAPPSGITGGMYPASPAGCIRRPVR